MLEKIKTKKCTKCNIYKDVVLFSTHKMTKDGLQTSCKVCAAAYREANKNKMAAYQAEYAKTNKDRLSKYTAEYYQDNRDIISECHKIYRKTEIGKAVIKNAEHKRRSLKRQGDVTTIQFMGLQNNAKVCYWCNKSLKNKTTHIDHYIPLSKGGEHTLNNLVASCPKCNMTKHAKDPLSFANSLGRLL